MISNLLQVPPDLQVDASFMERWPLLWAEEVADAGFASRSLMMNYRDYRWPAPQKNNWKWVYIARARGNGVVKVGLSSNPLRRIADLPHWCPGSGRFDAVGAIPNCSPAHEDALLGLLRGFVVTGREWFADVEPMRMFCCMVVRARSSCEARWAWKEFDWAMQALGRFADPATMPRKRRVRVA